jgi:hypothetical protein
MVSRTRPCPSVIQEPHLPVDKDKRKLELVRDVARRIAKQREQAATPKVPVLDSYVA